jgi:hypothetical protein
MLGKRMCLFKAVSSTGSSSTRQLQPELSMPLILLTQDMLSET